MSNGSSLEAEQQPVENADESISKKRTIPLGPVLTFFAIWLGGSTLVVGSILLPVLPGGWITVVAAIGLLGTPLFLLLRGLDGTIYPSRLTRLLIFRPFWYAMLFMPLLAATGTLAAFMAIPVGAGGVAGRWGLAGATIVLTVASLIGYAGARRLRVREMRVLLRGLPEEFYGLRIVQISDLHVGPHTSVGFLNRISQAVREARPDVIVYTGDQVDDFPQDVEHFNSAFANLRAPLGVFAVPGNHDVYAGWDAVRRGMSRAGITVLTNDAVPVERQGEKIWIVGTGDPAGVSWHRGGGWQAAPDLDRALLGVPPREVKVVLAHNPALWPELARRRVDLTLSGHTHYGQLAIPKWGWNIAGWFIKLSMGEHRQGNSLLYINPGTNYWGVPFRIGTPPEVTVLVLEPCNAGDVPRFDVRD